MRFFVAKFLLDDQADVILNRMRSHILEVSESPSICEDVDRNACLKFLLEAEEEHLQGAVGACVKASNLDHILSVFVGDGVVYIGLDIAEAFEQNIGQSAAELLIQSFCIPHGLKYKEFLALDIS